LNKATIPKPPGYASASPVAVVAKGECEVKNILKTSGKFLPVVLFLTLFCANPDKNVSWRTAVELPITANKKFILAAMMDTVFFNKIGVQTSISYDTIKRTGLPDSIEKIIDTTMMIEKAYPIHDTVLKKDVPDTVQFAFPTKDSAVDTISEDSLADKYYTDAFGPIPLTGIPPDTVIVPLAGPYVSGASVTLPTLPVTLKWVYHVELMDTAQFVNLTVTNNSPASFSQVAITLGSLGTATITNLPANASATVQYNARAKVIDSVMNVTAILTASSTGAFAAGNNLTASISFGSLYASKVIVLDSILAGYQRTFTNEYNLTDTVNVNYIDIGKGFFNYTVTNHSGAQLQISVTHRNLWRTDFCQGRVPPLTTVASLATLTLADSDLAYGGEVTPNTARVDFPAGDTSRFSKTNISGYRLFPEWDSVTQQSVTKVDYRIFAQVNNNRITLKSNDSLTFVIKTTSFKFVEMAGVSMYAVHRVGTPSDIPVKLPWGSTVTDSLRGKFVLRQVLAKTLTRLTIPQGAVIDTVLIHYDISSTIDPTIKTSQDAVLRHVIRDSLFERTVDITNVVNNYPDSVQVNVSMTIPAGTHTVIENDLIDPTDKTYSKYIGRMIIHGNVNYNLVAPLCWAILDTTTMDLGGARVDLSGVGGFFNYLDGLRDKHASINLRVTNFTNVFMRLYALAATDTAKIAPLVDTGNASYVNTNQFTGLINNPPAGYVNILGDGVLIPPRDSTQAVRDTVVLTDRDLSELLGAKKIGWRWEVRFLPKIKAGVTDSVPDALLNTDWIRLNSWLHVDGINSVDSLFR
jgi:hypothetical protein